MFTGSCPCQPFSNAGKRAGTSDTRHLWPHFYRLIAAAKPSVVFGEQVSSKLGYDWFDGVASDLESQNYQCEAVAIPAYAVNAPHKGTDYTGSLDYWGTPMKGFGNGGFRPNGKYGMSFLPNQVKQMWPTRNSQEGEKRRGRLNCQPGLDSVQSRW